MAFPTFIKGSPRLQIELINRALIPYLHLNSLELPHAKMWILQSHENSFSS